MRQESVRVNTHIHLPPNFSAFTTIDEAIDQAASERVTVLGASNYYDFTVYKRFAAKAAAKKIKPLFGIEIVCRIAAIAQRGIKINDPGNPGKMYICGKALTQYERQTPRAVELLRIIRLGDEFRIDAMVKLLLKVFEQAGIESDLSTKKIIEQVAARFGVEQATVVLQERHVAQAFQELLFAKVSVDWRRAAMENLFKATSKADAGDAVGVQAEIRTHLMKAGRPAFVDENFVTFEEARELITELGGFVSYPVLADGMSPLSGFEADPLGLVGRLKDLDIAAVEFIPNRNDPKLLTEYVDVLAKNGFSISAGTEHNTTERIPIVPQCKGGVAIPEEVQKLFVRGAMQQCEHQAVAALEV